MDRLVQARAKLALGNIHSQPGIAVPALVGILSQRNGSMHLTVQALGKFGSDAKEAIPALRLLLDNPNFNIRSSASNALQEIERDAAREAVRN
jgi:hypothetical protein